MHEFGQGKYDQLYSSTEQLWASKPGRVLDWMSQYSPTIGQAIDIGCGDGKNAVFLANFGADVVCIDVSEIALELLENRLSNEIENVARHISVTQADICDYELEPANFDCAVFYGVAHCMTWEKLKLCIEKIERSLKVGGWLCFCSFNSDLPVPESHNTGELFLREHNVLMSLLTNFLIIRVERGIISEEHPNVPLHSHALTWILAKKNE